MSEFSPVNDRDDRDNWDDWDAAFYVTYLKKSVLSTYLFSE